MWWSALTFRKHGVEETFYHRESLSVSGLPVALGHLARWLHVCGCVLGTTGKYFPLAAEIIDLQDVV